jgi:uncharacterized protein YndB with AHSA1/START domain
MGELWFWILLSLSVIIGAFAGIFLVGAFLPRAHEITRALNLKQTPDAVWQLITDYANVPSWQQNVIKVEKQPDKNGHEVWKETYKNNYGLFLETVEVAAPTRLVRTIADDKGPFTGRWEFSLTAVEGGCKLEITEFGEVGNPFFRFMFRLFMRPEVYLEMYLTALAKKFGEPPVFVQT